MRKFIFVFLLVISIQQLFACDICGCSSGNLFLGPVPIFNKHFIGIRYSFRSFSTVLKDDNNQFSNDFYQTTELWGGFKIKNKFQVLGFVPFNINHSNTDDGIKSNNGFGDMSVLGNYNIFNKMSLNKDTMTVGQQLWIGAGVKLPTGHFSVESSENVSSANSQAGSGSLDCLLTASYTLVIDSWGLSSNINYKINQAASDFRFGNRYTANAFAFRSFQSGKNSFSPNVGLLYENLNPNELSKTKIKSTGGYDLLVAVGLETVFDRINIGFSAQIPLVSNLSDGQTKINMRGMLHLTYAF